MGKQKETIIELYGNDMNINYILSLPQCFI